MSPAPVTRRRLLGSLGLGACCGGLALPLPAAAGPDTAETLRGRLTLMGTQVDVVLPPQDRSLSDRQAAWVDAQAEMQRLADMMSRYRDDSVVSELARQAGRRAVEVPPEMMAVLVQAQALSRDSGGAFDATIGGLSHWHLDDAAAPLPSPAQVQADLRHVNHRALWLDPASRQARLRHAGMRLDLGGIAKLPILQAGMDRLARHGLRSALLNGGGDVLVSSRPGDAPWRIGLRDAVHPERLLAVLPLDQGVVASSGDYERGRWQAGRRFHHVLDPATGYPTQEVHGVSLVAAHTREVNGLGAAAMVMGARRGSHWLARDAARQALLVRQDGSLWVSPTLRERLLPPPGQTTIRGLA